MRSVLTVTYSDVDDRPAPEESKLSRVCLQVWSCILKKVYKTTRNIAAVLYSPVIFRVHVVTALAETEPVTSGSERRPGNQSSGHESGGKGGRGVGVKGRDGGGSGSGRSGVLVARVVVVIATALVVLLLVLVVLQVFVVAIVIV